MTNQIKHTPAPWYLDDYNEIKAERNDDKECVVIAEYRHTPLGLNGTRPLLLDEAKANARLIAAAPELLEALELAEQWIEEQRQEDEASEYPTLRHIRSVIAKARGLAA